METKQAHNFIAYKNLFYDVNHCAFPLILIFVFFLSLSLSQFSYRNYKILVEIHPLSAVPVQLVMIVSYCFPCPIQPESHEKKTTFTIKQTVLD